MDTDDILKTLHGEAGADAQYAMLRHVMEAMTKAMFGMFRAHGGSGVGTHSGTSGHFIFGTDD